MQGNTIGEKGNEKEKENKRKICEWKIKIKNKRNFSFLLKFSLSNFNTFTLD